MADVVVIGAGRMGSQIACEYALGGHRVALFARDRERAGVAACSAFGVAARAGRHAEDALATAADRLRVVTDLAEVEDAPEIVVESIPEDIELKANVLAPVAERWPDTIVASNTSGLPIGELGAAVGAPERTVGTHYWNPPLLMPLVEIIRGERTSSEVVDRVTDLIVGLGKRPVHVRRDVPGFIWNRLQCALLREALWLVDEGVATPEDVDLVVKDGLARRSRYTGPFETAELGGLHTFAKIAENLFPELSTATDAPTLQGWSPREETDLAEIARRRDVGLARELEEGR